MTWARDYFEHGYALRWGLGPPSAETHRAAEALWNHLRLGPRDSLVDVACGHGRHAVALAALGARVVGVDFASNLLARATTLAHQLAVAVDWVRGDMRRLPLRSRSAHAAMIIDAFGYFDTEAENALVLKELGRVVAPGGRIALKVVNAVPMLEQFRATDQEVRRDATIAITRTLLADPRRLVEDITIRGPLGESSYQRRQQLYDRSSLLEAAGAAGFQPVSVAATFDGQAFDSRTSSFVVLVAERVGA
jgi:SAM-dependent methyltransferase